MKNDPLEPIISGMIKVIDEKLKKDPSAKTLCLTMSRDTAEDLRGELSYLSYLRKSPLIKHKDKMKVVRCKDCKYRPVPTKQRGAFGGGSGLEFPVDFKCPCQCDDPYYSWIPKDDWFCADGERKEDND